MDHKEIAEQIFLAGVDGVLPVNLISSEISLIDDNLKIGGLTFPSGSINNIYIIGAGKASAVMALEIEKILGDRITDGHIVVKYGYSCELKYIDVTEAGHPVPDSNGLKATREILKIAEKADSYDLVICLISGGGSSLLWDVPEGCIPEDIIRLNEQLINSGACISEINAVRKHLSIVKGGQLAKAVSPATLVNLILSDVPGDQLEVIASGPTVADSTTFEQALTVLSTYGLTEVIPDKVFNLLLEGVKGLRPETPKSGDSVFNRTYNLLIGTNRKALESSKNKSLEYNINAVIMDDQLQGDVGSVAEYIVETAERFKHDKNEVKPVCLLFGGETTVKMTGKGIGGRNQHFALLSALLLEEYPGITILSAGTDGSDGPTDAAGAVVDSATIKEVRLKNIDPQTYLADFDSYNFFNEAGGHVITGPTMTNVMDIIVVIVE